MRSLPLLLILCACAENPATTGSAGVGEGPAPLAAQEQEDRSVGHLSSAAGSEGPAAHPDDPDGWVPVDEYAGLEVIVEREFHPGGVLRRIACYLPDQVGDPSGRHGPEWSFFKNGYKKEALLFERGVKQGEFIRAWQNGQIRYQGTFVDGQRHGSYRQWWENGDLQMEFTYNLGQPTGTWREWYVDESPRLEESYVDGLLHGERRTWDKPREDEAGNSNPGVLTALENYVAGKKHGPWKDFDPHSGKPRTMGSYEEGVRVGTWQVRWPEGQLLDEFSYKDEQLHGKQRKFTPEGNPLEEVTWNQGAKTGPARLFFADGKLQAEGSYLDAERHGVWRYYSPTGEVIPTWSGVFENDQKVGELPDDS